MPALVITSAEGVDKASHTVDDFADVFIKKKKKPGKSRANPRRIEINRFIIRLEMKNFATESTHERGEGGTRGQLGSQKPHDRKKTQVVFDAFPGVENRVFSASTRP